MRETGIPSVGKVFAAVKAGPAVLVASDFFLYLGSQVAGMDMPMVHQAHRMSPRRVGWDMRGSTLISPRPARRRS
jgi:hypothetical protein